MTVWSHVIEDMDEAFKALADDSRRALLDALHDGVANRCMSFAPFVRR